MGKKKRWIFWTYLIVMILIYLITNTSQSITSCPTQSAFTGSLHSNPQKCLVSARNRASRHDILFQTKVYWLYNHKVSSHTSSNNTACAFQAGAVYHKKVIFPRPSPNLKRCPKVLLLIINIKKELFKTLYL